MLVRYIKHDFDLQTLLYSNMITKFYQKVHGELDTSYVEELYEVAQETDGVVIQITQENTELSYYALVDFRFEEKIMSVTYEKEKKTYMFEITQFNSKEKIYAGTLAETLEEAERFIESVQLRNWKSYELYSIEGDKNHGYNS